MTLQPTVGSLVVVDPNLPSMSVLWDGLILPHIISVRLANGVGNERCIIRVVNPRFVEPRLSADEITRLNTAYAAMEAAGINVIKQRRN